MKTPTRLGGVALVVGIALLVAVASASGGSSASGDPLKIFVMAIVGTPTSNQPDIQYGAEAAAAAINKKGGVKGRPIEIVFCNTRNDANTEIGCVRDALDQKIVATAALNSAPNSLALLENAKIPQIGYGNNPPDFVRPYAFPLTGGAPISYMADELALKKAGAKSVAGITIDNPAAFPFITYIKTAARAAGLKYAGTIVVPATLLPDYAPYAQKLKDLGADSAVFVSSISIAAAMMRSSSQLGLNTKFAHTTTSVGDAEAKSLGDVANGEILGCTLPPAGTTTNPGIRQFNAEMDADNQPTDFRRYIGVNAWLSIYAFARVASTIKGDINSTSLLTALRTWPKNKPIDLFGLVKWVPSATGPAAFPRLANGSAYFCQVKDGSVVLASPKPVDIYAAMGLVKKK